MSHGKNTNTRWKCDASELFAAVCIADGQTTRTMQAKSIDECVNATVIEAAQLDQLRMLADATGSGACEALTAKLVELGLANDSTIQAEVGGSPLDWQEHQQNHEPYKMAEWHYPLFSSGQELPSPLLCRQLPRWLLTCKLGFNGCSTVCTSGWSTLRLQCTNQAAANVSIHA